MRKAILVGMMVLSLSFFGAPAWADLVNSVPIDISVDLQSSGNYSLEVDPSALTGFTVDFSQLDPTEAWVVANGNIKIKVGTPQPMGSWGVRVVTENKNLESANGGPYNGTVVGYQLDPQGTKFAYGGLIKIEDTDGDGNPDTISQNPADRVTLAWQVYDTEQANPPAAPTDASFDVDGDNVPGDWNAPWAYTADKSDTSYQDFVNAHGEDTVWYEVNGQNALNYSVACFGGILGAKLSSHPYDPNNAFPEMTDSDGDGLYDAYLYLAGKFANTYYYDLDGDGDYETSQEQFVTVGHYTTKLYVELFTE